MSVSVEWLDDWDAVAADAAGALDRARQPRLFDRLDWYRLTQAHLPSDSRPITLRARAGAASAWLFLTTNGKTATPLTSWYSLGGGPVLDGPVDDALLIALFRAAGRRFGRIALHPLDAEQEARLRPLLRKAGWRGFTSPASTNWTIDVAGMDFAAYWAGRPAKLRNTVQRRERSHPLKIRIHRAFDATAWDAWRSVYEASWKPAEGSWPFLRALAEQEGTAGTLRLGIAEDMDGRVIAGQFWLVENRVATIHKLAHREDAKAGSPGSILSRDLFRAAIDEDHVERIDFGLGVEPYKAEWMDVPRPIFRIDAYRLASPVGAIGMAREVASRLVHRRPLN